MVPFRISFNKKVINVAGTNEHIPRVFTTIFGDIGLGQKKRRILSFFRKRTKFRIKASMCLTVLIGGKVALHCSTFLDAK